MRLRTCATSFIERHQPIAFGEYFCLAQSIALGPRLPCKACILLQARKNLAQELHCSFNEGSEQIGQKFESFMGSLNSKAFHNAHFNQAPMMPDFRAFGFAMSLLACDFSWCMLYCSALYRLIPKNCFNYSWVKQNQYLRKFDDSSI